MNACACLVLLVGSHCEDPESYYPLALTNLCFWIKFLCSGQAWFCSFGNTIRLVVEAIVEKVSMFGSPIYCFGLLGGIKVLNLVLDFFLCLRMLFFSLYLNFYRQEMTEASLNVPPVKCILLTLSLIDLWCAPLTFKGNKGGTSKEKSASCPF